MFNVTFQPFLTPAIYILSDHCFDHVTQASVSALFVPFIASGPAGRKHVIVGVGSGGVFSLHDKRQAVAASLNSFQGHAHHYLSFPSGSSVLKVLLTSNSSRGRSKALGYIQGQTKEKKGLSPHSYTWLMRVETVSLSSLYCAVWHA